MVKGIKASVVLQLENQNFVFSKNQAGNIFLEQGPKLSFLGRCSKLGTGLIYGLGFIFSFFRRGKECEIFFKEFFSGRRCSHTIDGELTDLKRVALPIINDEAYIDYINTLFLHRNTKEIKKILEKGNNQDAYFMLNRLLSHCKYEHGAELFNKDAWKYNETRQFLEELSKYFKPVVNQQNKTTKNTVIMEAINTQRIDFVLAMFKVFKKEINLNLKNNRGHDLSGVFSYFAQSYDWDNSLDSIFKRLLPFIPNLKKPDL